MRIVKAEDLACCAMGWSGSSTPTGSRSSRR